MAESRERARAGARRVRTARVLRTARVTPRMVRIVLGGDDLADLEAGEYADEYVKLLFAQPELERPAIRSITVRRWDPDATELTIDVVDHGPGGLAGPWAVAAQPGDEIELRGPGGSYS